jgi:hypothetical protein
MPASEDTASPATAHERALLASAVRALAGDGEVLDAAALAGDPPDPAVLDAALRERAGERAVITCAGLLERLADFVGVVETLVALAAEHDATVVITVPNDRFAGAPDERSRSAWGEGAVAELRQLLPSDHVPYDLLTLRGAALVPAAAGAELSVPVEVDPGTAAPVGFVLAFGPRAAGLAASASIGAADLSGERAHERAREAELEVLRARLAALDPRAELAPGNGDQP